ncbi:hypothetical protein STIAU_5934 [Stigmatella aurantiaca DW4/3-1]|nr:hypothetical protein STIAU_5934 [Stigmatella aurantiaca DW4/3-1]
MHLPHEEVAPCILDALECYCREVGPQSLGFYVDYEGNWQQLDGFRQRELRREMLEGQWTLLEMRDTPQEVGAYGFSYYGKSRATLDAASASDAVSAVSFWLPTEYLEASGPEHVRAFALHLAATLPWSSGHAGLAFKSLTGLLETEESRQLCLRYPGIDVADVSTISWHLGQRVRVPSWMNFMRPPVQALPHLIQTGFDFQSLEEGRAVITLGLWPEAGDLTEGRNLPLYRELVRTLEPWRYHEHVPRRSLMGEHVRRWDRRFLE